MAPPPLELDGFEIVAALISKAVPERMPSAYFIYTPPPFEVVELLLIVPPEKT